MTRAQAIDGVVTDLEGWTQRFVEAVRAGDAQQTEDAVASLVDWLGHDLVDGLRSIDLPSWERLSGVAEELLNGFRAVQAAMGTARGGSGPASGPRAAGVEAGFEMILERARAVRDAGEAAWH